MAALKKNSKDDEQEKRLKTQGVKRIVKKRKPVDGIRKRISRSKSLERHPQNPIIKPTSEDHWQSRAAFNAAALENEGKIHVIYRAVGHDDLSRWGYAESDDGINFNNVSSKPIYTHSHERAVAKNWLDEIPLLYLSGGGGNGGAEDPRVVKIDGKIYAIYTAFDGWSSVRINLTSISLEDFLNKRWNWKEPVAISPPNEIHKNWVLFPEKIGGRFAILHSFYPRIRIDFFDSLDELDGKTFIKSDNSRPVDTTRRWDSWFRGVGPPPIKTKDGWLIIYHAMDHLNADRYRMGALLLDLEDPTKVLYRLKSPILSPEVDYENNGHKRGVVYSCGALVRNGELIVYYGGSDMVTCVATANLEKFLAELKRNGKITLTKSRKVKS